MMMHNNNNNNNNMTPYYDYTADTHPQSSGIPNKGAYGPPYPPPQQQQPYPPPPPYAQPRTTTVSVSVTVPDAVLDPPLLARLQKSLFFSAAVFVISLAFVIVFASSQRPVQMALEAVLCISAAASSVLGYSAVSAGHAQLSGNGGSAEQAARRLTIATGCTFFASFLLHFATIGLTAGGVGGNNEGGFGEPDDTDLFAVIFPLAAAWPVMAFLAFFALAVARHFSVAVVSSPAAMP